MDHTLDVSCVTPDGDTVSSHSLIGRVIPAHIHVDTSPHFVYNVDVSALQHVTWLEVWR
jgi:hypothetical protein